MSSTAPSTYPTTTGAGSCEDVAADMIRIPAGSFLMGCESGAAAERPVHEVSVDEFWIDRYPVTNARFAAFVERTGYTTTAERQGKAWGYNDGRFAEIAGLCWRDHATADRAEHPVVLVSWFDAVAFAAWAGKRLPTEAEWEQTARGGLEQALYPWGDEEPDLSRAHFNAPPRECPSTAAVGTSAPNGYGVSDIVGNVWQWCSDWFGTETYGSSATSNPIGAASGTLKVRRGGSWNVIQHFRLRCANRGAMNPSAAAPNMGFRCAR
jgi:sulfatase modifying factor 1